MRLALSAAIAASMLTSAHAQQVVATFTLVRHGDRTSNYGNPWNFTEAADILTPLGKTMLFNQGDFIRSQYIISNSSTAIQGMSPIWSPALVSASASSNNVILDSAQAFLQGAFPPTLNSSDPTMSVTLANGTTYYAPLNGYQYVPVSTMPDSSDLAFDGWLNCPTMTNAFRSFQSTQAYMDMANAAQPWLNEVAGPLVDGRPTDFAEVYDIWDLLNYEYTYNINNMTSRLGQGNYLYLKSLANWMQYQTYAGKYSSITTIAGATFANQLYTDINTTISSATKSPKFVFYADGFQTFISFFGLYNLTDSNPEFQSITEFGSALVFEVSTKSTGINSTQFSDYNIRMLYRNGTDAGAPLTPYALFNQPSDTLSLDLFLSNLSARALTNLTTWCSLCGNTNSRGCQYLASSSSSSSSCSSGPVSPVGAGFIGAAVALVIGGAAAAAFLFFRRRSHYPRRGDSDSVLKMNDVSH